MAKFVLHTDEHWYIFTLPFSLLIFCVVKREREKKTHVSYAVANKVNMKRKKKLISAADIQKISASHANIAKHSVSWAIAIRTFDVVSILHLWSCTTASRQIHSTTRPTRRVRLLRHAHYKWSSFLNAPYR